MTQSTVFTYQGRRTAPGGTDFNHSGVTMLQDILIVSARGSWDAA